MIKRISVVFSLFLLLTSGMSAETRKEWETTVDIPLTSYWEEDLVAIARTQIGYEESKSSYRVVDFDRKGYTRYGDWYGNRYMDWCTCFVSFCAYYAGIPIKLKAGNITGLINIGKRYRSYHLAADHPPEKGDIFFRTSEDPYAIKNRLISHCGIVTDVSGTVIYTIEGNVDNAVVEKAYFRDDPVICSYISIWDLMKADGIVVIEQEMPKVEMEPETESTYYAVFDDNEYYLRP